MLKKALVLAAGKGTRMLQLSKDKPKHLIDINGKPFLYYLLKNLKEAGFKEVVMVVGYKKFVMEEFLEEYKNEFNLTLVNQFEILGKERYGTACPLECVKDILGNESFITVYGDNLYSVEDLKNFNIDDEYSYVAGMHHEQPQDYGVLQVDQDGFLKEIIEKPKEPVGNLINTGPFKFTPEIFKYLDKIEKSPRGEYEIVDVINFLAQEKKVKVKEIKGTWLDLGKPDDVQKIANHIK